jgi:uncharacterized damage-inducible protein DinB
MRPDPDEFAPYYDRYISLVGGSVREALGQQLETFSQYIRSIPDEKANFAYAPGKWTVKEVIGHVIDTERIMAYRALRIARGDQTPLAGFEQDDYAARGHFSTRALADLAMEFETLRRANLALFDSFDQAMLLERGTASGHPVSVRALLYIIAGHALHHHAILKERYAI